MSEPQSETDKRIKSIDEKIKILEQKVDAGEITSEEYIPRLFELFYEIEKLSPKSRKAMENKINFKGTLLGGIIGWAIFFLAFTFLGPLEFSLRSSTISSTGIGTYQTMLSLISYSDISSIQSSQPFFVFMYYLIISLSTFPDLLTMAFPILGGLVAGTITQVTSSTRNNSFANACRGELGRARLNEGFIAGGVVPAILTLIILVISTFSYGQWLLGKGIVLDETTLPLGYIFRVFLPTLFLYHLTLGGAFGALGEMIMSRRVTR